MASVTLTIKTPAGYTRTFVDADVSTANNTVNIPDHGLANGDVVRFTNSDGGLPTGLTSNHPYYVVSAATDTFKVSETSGGSAVDITAAAGGGTHTMAKERTRWHDKLVRSSGAPKEAALGLSQYFNDLASGHETGLVDIHTAPAHPVAAGVTTITCASVNADDTVTIGGVTLTAKASPSGEAQWSQAGTDTQDGASLASCINSHSSLGRFLTASNESGVVTITCKVKGQIGNLITVASSNGTRLACSAATLTGGTGGPAGTAVTYTLGL